MSVLMKIRKGTKAQLTAYGHLEAGELGFTTDENLVYVGDGSSNIVAVIASCTFWGITG